MRSRLFALLFLLIAAPVFASTPPAEFGQYEKTIADASNEISKGRNLPCSYHRRGVAYLKLQAFEKAIWDFQKLRQFEKVICHDGEQVYGIDIGQIHYLEGGCWYDMNRFDQAVFSFKSAVATDGYMVPKRLYYLMGKSYRYQLLWEDAIAAYTQAISMDPKYAEAYYARGVVYGRIGIKHKERQDKSYARYLDPDLTSERDWEIVSGLAMAFGVLLIVFLLFRTMTGMLFKTSEPVVVKGRPSYFMCFLVIILLSSMLYFWLLSSASSSAHLFWQDPQGRSASLFFLAASLLAGIMYLNLAVKEFMVTETSLYLSSIFWLGGVRRIELSQIRDIETILILRGPNTIQFYLNSGKRYQVAFLHDADGLVDQVKPLLQGSDAALVAQSR